MVEPVYPCAQRQENETASWGGETGTASWIRPAERTQRPLGPAGLVNQLIFPGKSGVSAGTASGDLNQIVNTFMGNYRPLPAFTSSLSFICFSLRLADARRLNISTSSEKPMAK